MPQFEDLLRFVNLFNLNRFVSELKQLVPYFLQIFKKKQGLILNSKLLLAYLRPVINTFQTLIPRTLEDHRGYDREEIFSKKVKAGKRTYFFDIKSTRGNDYYLTITESKRRMDGENFSYEKHKIFLYKEDFFKFVNALNEAVDHVKNDLLPDFDFEQFENEDSEKELDNDLRWE